LDDLQDFHVRLDHHIIDAMVMGIHFPFAVSSCYWISWHIDERVVLVVDVQGDKVVRDLRDWELVGLTVFAP